MNGSKQHGSKNSSPLGLLKGGLPRRRATCSPGFGLAMGFTLVYLPLVVLVPLSTLFWKSATLGWSGFWQAVSSPRVWPPTSSRFGTALVAATLNAVFGLVVTWVLVRYRFPGRRLVDALVDLPFALPTAVAGIALTTLYAPNGWLGRSARAARASRSPSRRSASSWRSPSSACPSWCARCSRCSRTSTPRSRKRPRAWAPTGCR